MASTIRLYVYRASDVFKRAASKVRMCVGTDLSLSRVTLITVRSLEHPMYFVSDCIRVLN
jgi:hypothetical protein